MLYEITLICISLISLCTSVCALYVVFRVLGAVRGAEQPKKVTRAQKKRIKKAEIKASEEQRRLETFLENLERYDGTGFGQKEIE